MPGRTTRTTQPHDFLELNDRQFEDLVRQLAGTSEVAWSRAPEPVGRLGSDRGRDIRGWERVPVPKGHKAEREWRYQAKRWKEIGPTQIRAVVREAVPDPSDVPHALVIAVACRVSNRGFEAFEDEAQKVGIHHHELWPRDTLNDKLLRNENARIAAFYFGDGPAIEGTVPIPLTLDRSAGRDITLLGRDDGVLRLLASPADVILVGRPGTGKSRLAMEAAGVRFLTSRADADAVAESLRQRVPAHVVVDDAALAVDRLEMLLELRREGHQFAIIATTWTESLDVIKRWLPEATIIELSLLERSTIDDLLKGLGITNYYLRGAILDQAEGRPGWAVALADLAKRGGGRDVISGRALIDQVKPYLAHLGTSSVKALGLLSVIGALGRVSLVNELTEVEAYLEIGRLEGQHLLQEAAAAGVLELRNDALQIAPKALRFALVAYWFFEQVPAPWPIDDLLARWPDHRDAIRRAVLEAAWDGSEKAREYLDQLVPSVSDVPYGMIDRYVALDERAAERAMAELDQLPAESALRLDILRTAATRFTTPSAVRQLLDLAVDDHRLEHPNPNHPIRILGEIGSRVGPHNETSFDSRAHIATIGTEWFDADPSERRQLVWAKVMAHLLDPKVEGHFADPGSPMTITLRGGFETPEHLRALIRNLWPAVAQRLDRLGSEALVAIVEVADRWIRLSRRIEGAYGAKPTEEAASIALSFVDQLLSELSKACDGKPAAQMALKDTAQLLGLSVRQKIDPEFRLLSWKSWRMGRRDHSGLVARLVGRLVDGWAAEEPTALMTRVANLSAEAARRQENFFPMIHAVFKALADRVGDPVDLVTAGLTAGLAWELHPLFKASIHHSQGTPTWIPVALAGAARSTTLAAALESGANRDATEAALTALGPQDLLVVEQAVINRGRSGHDWVSRALLSHSVEEVRGTASLWFGLDTSDQAATLPDDWYTDWTGAFVAAPLLSARGGDNYRLGEQLVRLVDRDPDVAERWLARQLTINPHETLYRLPTDAQESLSRLPTAHRDRLMRGVGSKTSKAELLSYLAGADVSWLEQLLDDGRVDVDDVASSLYHNDREVPDRIVRILALAPVLLPRGIKPKALARAAEFGSSMGERSAVYEAIRVAFEATPPSADPHIEAVRLAGVDTFGRGRDEALREERNRRIVGDL
jgi:hypothetical protein